MFLLYRDFPPVETNLSTNILITLLFFFLVPTDPTVVLEICTLTHCYGHRPWPDLLNPLQGHSKGINCRRKDIKNAVRKGGLWAWKEKGNLPLPVSIFFLRIFQRNLYLLPLVGATFDRLFNIMEALAEREKNIVLGGKGATRDRAGMQGGGRPGTVESCCSTNGWRRDQTSVAHGL